ncbi:MAG TPA: Gfo/Idh/MocA family oxidoreductase [bacterium]|nr:Gfo/Idh/MocA family oxidoreductase [bacterium]
MAAKQKRIVRVGLIAVEPWAKMLAAAYRELKYVELTAAYRQKVDGAKTFEDWREMLAADEVEAIDVHMPLSMHRPIVEAACARKKHIAINPPLAATAKEAEELRRLAAKSGVKLVVMDTLLRHPFTRQAKELLDDDQVGEIQVIRIKSNLGGKGGFGPGLEPGEFSPAAFDTHPAFAKREVIEYLMGPIVAVKTYEGPRARMEAYKFKADSRYGVHEMVFSPELEVMSEGAPTDDSIEITGTDGILWIRNLTALMVEAPKLMLKRKDKVTVWDDRIDYDFLHVQRSMREAFAASL